MKTIISIEGAEFYAFHGFYPEERMHGHTFVVFADATIDSLILPEDEIDTTLNYERIYDIVKSEMDRTQKLLETVCYNILTRIKESNPLISGCRVRIEKMGPQLGGKVAKSVVEMEI